MAEIVIVGGGVGGVVAVKRLRRALGGGHRVTVLDRARDHLFQPSLLWVADGTRRPERLSRPLSRLNRRGVSVRFGAVQGLDLNARRVRRCVHSQGTDENGIPVIVTCSWFR